MRLRRIPRKRRWSKVGKIRYHERLIMRFGDLYRLGEPAVSFELFPPRSDEGLENLKERLARLLALRPAFVTVTYGAMGSTQEKTLEIATLLRQYWKWDTAHHLTCVGAGREEIDRVIDRIEAAGIENIVALRGDPPAGQERFKVAPGGYRNAWQLVEHIRRRRAFGIAVAGYPEKHLEAPDEESDLRYLKQKVDCGADVVITQLFYDNRRYFEFVKKCRAVGIEQPIVPGLLPILNVNQIRRITQLCGATIPQRLLAKLEEVQDDQQRVRALGIQHTARQAARLLEQGVPGIHFYVLNRCFHIREIMEHLHCETGFQPSIPAKAAPS